MILHGAIFVAILLFAWWSQREQERPQIFELVAGEGMDYLATEAPTTEAPATSVKAPPLPEPVTVPPPPKIERVPEPKPQPKTPPKQETPPPPKEKAPPVPKEKAPPAPKIEKAPERLKFDQFTKEHGAPKTPTPKTAPKITPKKIDADRIAGRVVTGSTNSVKAGAGGTAMTRTEMDVWAAYQSLLIERIRRSMQQAGILDLRSAGVEFSISVEGVISNARITAGSGSREFDEGILAALRGLGRVPPPPSGKAERLQVTINLRERN